MSHVDLPDDFESKMKVRKRGRPAHNLRPASADDPQSSSDSPLTSPSPSASPEANTVEEAAVQRRQALDIAVEESFRSTPQLPVTPAVGDDGPEPPRFVETGGTTWSGTFLRCRRQSEEPQCWDQVTVKLDDLPFFFDAQVSMTR